MIRVTVRTVAEARGINKAYQLAKQTGIHQSLAARLWKGDVYPNLVTLDWLCGLWKCRLDELIYWVPDKRTKAPTRQNGSKKKSIRKRS